MFLTRVSDLPDLQFETETNNDEDEKEAIEPEESVDSNEERDLSDTYCESSEEDTTLVNKRQNKILKSSQTLDMNEDEINIFEDDVSLVKKSDRRRESKSVKAKTGE